MVLIWCALLGSLLVGGQTNDRRIPLSADEQQLLDLANAARKKEGLPALQLNAVLLRIAREHAANMARQEKMAHHLDGKGPAERAIQAGYDYLVIRENLACAENEVDVAPPPPSEIHQKWLDSKGHRANLLHPRVNEIGLARVRSKKGAYFYVQVLGLRRE